jgi:SnoaL-like polyketide cyclase
MSKEQENKAIAVRWLEGFWGHSWTPEIVDDLAADDIVIQFSLQTPCRGRSTAKNFLLGIREIFQGLEFHSSADIVVDGEYVTVRLEGFGTHAGAAFLDFFIGFFPAHSGRKVHLAGKTTLRIKNDKIVEEMTRVTWAMEQPRLQKVAA